MKYMLLSSRKNAIQKISVVILFSFIFFLTSGLFLQTIVIPLTPWHAGNGLLTGGDWLYFHELAVNLAEKIEREGWQVWQARPEGQAPAGVAGFLYALTGIHKPWVILPINAILCSIATGGLYSILYNISGSFRDSLTALLPIFFLPSLVILYAQIHKDVWVLAGLFSILSIWVQIAKQRTLNFFYSFLILLFSNISIWYVRPYALKLLILGQMLMLIILGIAILFNRQYKSKNISTAILSIFLTFSMIIVDNLNSNPKTRENVPPPNCEWVYTLPIHPIDEILKNISCTRNGFISGYPKATANLDTEITFTKAIDVLKYLPRAIQISIFAPFPNQWIDVNLPSNSKVMRLISAAEMIFLYFSLLGGLFAIFSYRNNDKIKNSMNFTPIIMLYAFSLSWIIIYSFVVINIGSIYRVRFPSMLLWISFGLLSWQLWFKKSKHINKHEK